MPERKPKQKPKEGQIKPLDHPEGCRCHKCCPEDYPCVQTVNVCCCTSKKPEQEPPPAPKPCCCCGSCVFEVRLQGFTWTSGSPGWFDKWAEISFVTHVNGCMYNFPSANGTYVRVHPKAKGKWFPLNARAGIVEVPCKGGRAIDMMTEMIEHPAKEKGLSAILEGGRPWGASKVDTVTLRCGEKPNAQSQVVKLQLGGNWTENMEVWVEYRFSQVTACSCCCGTE